MSKSKKILKYTCNNSLHDTQVFTKGKDKLTFKAIFKCAEFNIIESDLPKPNKSGELLDVDIGDDSTLSGYLESNWDIQVKDLKLKKKVQLIINEGADISELNELGFENTDGQYDIIPNGVDSVIVVDDKSNANKKSESVETLQSRGVFLVETEDPGNASEAVDVLTRAMDIELKNDPLGENLRFIRTSLAQAHALNEDYDTSLKVYEEVKNAYKEVEGKYSSGASWINSLISEIYIKLNKFDEAVHYKEQTILFDGYPPHMVDFAKLLSLANRKIDAIGVLREALSKSDYDNYEQQSRISLEIFEILSTEAEKSQDALEALKEATLSASLSGDTDLLKECKKVEKKFLNK